MGLVNRFRAGRRLIVVAALLSLLPSTALAQATFNVVTPNNGSGAGSLVPNSLPVAKDDKTIWDISNISVPAHAYLGNNTGSSAAPGFAQPTQIDIDPLAASSSSSSYSIPSSVRSVAVAAGFTTGGAWTMPAASSVPNGQVIDIRDPGNYVTRNNPLTLAESGTDTFNGIADKIAVGSPGSYIIATSDGTSNWHIEIISPPPNSLDFQKNFGGVPISIQGDSGCLLQLSTTTVTNCNHIWTKAEEALVGPNFKFIAQYVGTSNAEFVGYIATVHVGFSDFTINSVPALTGATNIHSLQSVQVVSRGSGYNFGSTICLSGGTPQTRGCVTTSDMTVTSAIVNNGGSGGTNGSYDCWLAPPLANRFTGVSGSSYALGGVQAKFTGTVSGNVLTALLAPTSGTGNYLALTGYAYDSSGAFDAVPVSCPGSGLSGLTADVKFGLVTVQNGAGHTAADGVYTGGMGWCVGMAAMQFSTNDNGSGASFNCQPTPALVWAYYDNQTNIENAATYLNGLASSQRPCVSVGAVFGTSPVPPSSGFNGRTCWKGKQAYATGFFMPSPGDTFPVIDSNQNDSVNATGAMVTDYNNPDQSGTFFENLTFWGDPTATTSTAQGNCAIRFYGLSGRWLISNVAVETWPGCLVGVGADASGGQTPSAGNLAEGVLIDTRSKFSGDSASRTPVIGCDAVGAIAGCNNVTSIRHRSYDDFYAAVRVSACTGGSGNNASHDTFIALKVEQSGMNEYNAPSHEVIINDPDCDGTISGTAIKFPIVVGTTATVDGSAATGAGDIRIVDSTLSNVATGTYAAFIGGLHRTDVNAIRLEGHINVSSGLGGGIQWNACSAACVADFDQNNTADYGLLATATPNANTIVSGSILYDGNGQPLPSDNVDSGISIACSQGLGVINSSLSCALAPMPANTLKGNGTGLSASPSDISMPSCSGSSSALQWTSGTGPNCGTMETRQTMGSYCNSQQATNVTAYYGLFGSCTSAAAAETSVNTFVAFSGTFRKLGCAVGTAPGAGQTETCTLRINGATPSGGPTCTITGSATSCTDSSNTATISAGGSADFRIVTSNGAAATRVFPYVEFDNP